MMRPAGCACWPRGLSFERLAITESASAHALVPAAGVLGRAACGKRMRQQQASAAATCDGRGLRRPRPVEPNIAVAHLVRRWVNIELCTDAAFKSPA